MIQDDYYLLNKMLEDMEKAHLFFKPTNYWQVYQNKLLPIIKREGIARFRASDCKIFSSFGVSQIPKTLTRQWLHDKQADFSLVDRITRALLRKNSFFIRSQKQHMETLQAFRNACFYFVLQGDKDKQILSIADSGYGDPQDLFSPLPSNNNKYTLSFLRYFHQLQWVRQFVDFSSIRSMLELGCGYGGQIEVIKKLYPNIKLVLCDIPPQLYVSEQYLKQVFPNEVTGYLETSRMDKIDLTHAKPITIIATWDLKKIIAPVDLFWSSTTFQEMEPVVVENYLNIIQSLETSFIYLLQSIKGKRVATKPGEMGVLEQTILEHYIQYLPNHLLTQQENAVFFASAVDGKQYITSYDVYHMLFQKRSSLML
ncbi:MAG: putative sugar O-methyltransferase [Magnetococcales bacterium]|nr:putative sugar O-methyltransferase [Magnetococcales bacterium]